MDVLSCEYMPAKNDAAASTAVEHPVAANDNLPLKSEWMTPMEALQTLLRVKQKLQRENIARHTLLASPARRKLWNELLACEHCLKWKYFRR